jgi:hypothetical protein
MDNVQKVYFKNLELFNYVLSPNIRTLDSYERIKNGVVMIFFKALFRYSPGGTEE